MFYRENKLLSMINTAGAFLMLIGIIVTGIELHSLNYYKKRQLILMKFMIGVILKLVLTLSLRPIMYGIMHTVMYLLIKL